MRALSAMMEIVNRAFVIFTNIIGLGLIVYLFYVRKDDEALETILFLGAYNAFMSRVNKKTDPTTALFLETEDNNEELTRSPPAPVM